MLYNKYYLAKLNPFSVFSFLPTIEYVSTGLYFLFFMIECVMKSVPSLYLVTYTSIYFVSFV